MSDTATRIRNLREKAGLNQQQLADRLEIPRPAVSAIEAGTRKWVIECKCGALQDFWETGTIRYKAVGEPRMLMACASCGKLSLQKVRRRRPGETVG